MSEMLDQFRQKNPAYQGVPDSKLADGLYRKFYAGKMPREEFDAKVGMIAEPTSEGITGPVSAVKNIGQGFNRGIGKVLSGADYALLGFLDDTKEGQAKRPLGYLAQVMKGEQDVPFTDSRFAREPVTAGEKILQRGGEMIGENLAPVGLAASAGKMALAPARNAAEAAIQGLVKSQAARPAITASGEAVSALGAGMGEEIGRQAAPGSVIAPLVGGIAGGLAPNTIAMPTTRKVIGKGVNAVRDMISPSIQAQRARDVVAGQLGPQLQGQTAQAGLERAKQIESQVPGFTPDLAQRTRDEALRATKDDIINRASGGELDDIRNRDVQSRQALRDFAAKNAPEGNAAADAVFDPLIRDRRAAAAQLRTTQKQVEALPKPAQIAQAEKLALQQLQERTAGARGEIAGRITRIDRGQAGQSIRESIRTERARRMEGINQAAADLGVDNLDLTPQYQNFYRSVGEWQATLLPSQADNMPDLIKDIAAIGAKPNVSLKDVKALRESAVDAVLDATRDTSPGHRKRLSNAVRLRGMIDDQILGGDDLDTASIAGTPDQIQKYKDFRRLYFEEIIEPFERGAVFKASRKDGTGFYRTLDEDVALDFLDSADSARQIRQIAQNQPGMLATLESVALDDLASTAVANGVVNPRSLERWLERRRGAVAELPNVQRAVGEIVSAVSDVEARFFRGKQAIDQRKAGEVARIGSERQRLEGAMRPLLERMGKLDERKMALEDTMLARRLASIERGSQDPANIVDQAVKNPALMKRLWGTLAPHDDARKALQRHLWDGLTSLDGKSLGNFLEDNQESLSLAFGKPHLDRLELLRDGLQMLEFSPAVKGGKPIKADVLSTIQATTGLNPQQMSSRFLAVQRGRSSRFVESFDSLMRWMSARNAQAMERLMKEALWNPEVAESLVESVRLNPSGVPNKKLRAWLWNLGLTSAMPGEENETPAPALPAPVAPPQPQPTPPGPSPLSMAPPAPTPPPQPRINITSALQDPTQMTRIWSATTGNNELRRAVRKEAWSGLAEPTGSAVKEWSSANAKGLRAIYPPDHIRRVEILADGMALADGSGMVEKPTRSSIAVAQFSAWLGKRDPEAAEMLMREALANPDVASAITESLAVKAPKPGASTLDQYANKKLMTHMTRLGIAGDPLEQMTGG